MSVNFFPQSTSSSARTNSSSISSYLPMSVTTSTDYSGTVGVLDGQINSTSPNSPSSALPSSSSAARIAANFGGKTITMVGSVCLLFNNLTGSGMVLFPSIFQAAGWLIVLLALVAVALLSMVCALMLLEAIALIPNNSKFTKRIEYTSCARFYLESSASPISDPRHRHWCYLLIQFFFQCSLLLNNLAMIIQSVQIMDFALAAMFGRTCATPQIYPSFSFQCPDPQDGHATPFPQDWYLLSLGFILTAILCVPLGFFNLDDEIIVQKFSFISVIAIFFMWIGFFFSSDHLDGFDISRVPAVGADFDSVLGVTVFNFAIITSLPSWANEKKEEVKIGKTLGVSVTAALLIFLGIGFFGGAAYEPWYNGDSSDETLLGKIHDEHSHLGDATFYLFPIVVNLTSIPIFSIMQRYNLINEKVCSKPVATFVSVLLPWLLCMPFFNGDGFGNVVQWAGLIFNSVSNFIVPPLIYVIAMKFKEQQKAQQAFFSSTIGNLHATEEQHQKSREKQQVISTQLKQSLIADSSETSGLASDESIDDYENDDDESPNGNGSYQPPGSITVDASDIPPVRSMVMDAPSPLSPSLATGVASHVFSAHTSSLRRSDDHKTNHVFNWPARLYPHRMRIAKLLVVVMAALCLITLALNIKQLVE